MTFKFVACIHYADDSDNYDIYHFNKDIPFEADSLENALHMVKNAVEADGKEIEYNSPDYDPEKTVEHSGFFGHSFGKISEGQSLDVQVMSLDDWFEKNKKPIDYKPSY